ncbi:MAG: FeoB-associated Cys-rich membrane protein [Bacteroidales bacterium]|jgi:hypothetical protein|nr:FeoB-associated Cys-rich membrane protein [Bacteroidales bacterium]MDI9592775.1 FeoB-associated Cys-rich membrane protein [Bacteroidota bacterium]HNY59731.1 FeoB-associated Cys-rich membrane protein [Bacteroidales bacterium]HOG66820.1 FeoB-associated Cys-rich membrane protein [Bacteroidales bacterium]HPA11920.1 FeoB-associated Cys-rich membrane protein [Bacteroidales bacterium]
MIQEILTYIILLVTLTLVVNNAIRFFKDNSGGCAGCPSGASCKIAALKHKMDAEK